MPIFHRLNTLWRNLFRKKRVEADLENEIGAYRELLEDEKAKAGAAADAARREALLELGGAEQIKERVREIRLGASLYGLAAEVRQSLRGLRRNPSLTILGTAMLALGTGASIAVFSIFQSALLKPLPFRDVDRVVNLWETRNDRGIDQAAFSDANFWDVRAQAHAFEDVAEYHYGEANLTGQGAAEKVTFSAVTTSFFQTLGVSPILGRDFSSDDENTSATSRSVILGNKFWKTHFSGNANVLGQTLRVDGLSCTVIGVLPPGDAWTSDQIYFPYRHRPDADRSSWEFSVIGRLKAGVTLQGAQADLATEAASLSQSYPRDDKGIGFYLTPSSDWVAPDTTRRALWVLLGAVTFLLLIACLNITNLLLARGTARQREIAVRTALGAGRGRLIRFVMMESLLLNAFGTALGLALAYGAVRAIQSLEISDIPRLADAGLNPWVLGYAVGIAILTGVFSGIAPALQAPRLGISAALRDGDRQTGTSGQNRFRSALVAGEVILSFLLLVGAGLLIRSFTDLLRVNRGFQTQNRLFFSVNMPESYYEKGVGKQFTDRLFERLSANPDVLAAGAVSNRPIEGGDPGMSIDSTARPQTAGAVAPPWASWRVVSPGYFQAVGLPLLHGRLFDEADKPVWIRKGETPYQRRVLVSDRLAKQLFPNEDAVGKHVLLWKGQSNLDAEVVGVVGDSLERGLSSSPTLTVFLPYGLIALSTQFVVHTRNNPLAFVPTVRSLVTALDPSLPISDIRSFDQVVYRSVAPQRFNTILLSVFSGLALLLATTGIYGVLSYSISRRTPEIGLRVALGATRSDILAMTIRQGLRPALLGTALGALGALWFSRYLATLLFGVKPFDALTYISVAGILLITALAACYVPGRRAMRTDPATALRAE